MSKPDKESKTEEATEKKVADAIEKGNVPHSREISVFASLLGMLIAAAFVIGPQTHALSTSMMVLIDQPGDFAVAGGHDANQLLWGVCLVVGGFLIPEQDLEFLKPSPIQRG